MPILRARSIKNPFVEFDGRIRRNRPIDTMTLKLKSETVNPASKQGFTVSSVVYKAAGVDHRYKH